MHTPGPLEAFYEDSLNGVMAVGGSDLCHCFFTDEMDGGRIPMFRDSARDNARLLAAAYTSYDRHCGPKSIELAEGDLLGELIAVCRRIKVEAEHEDPDDSQILDEAYPMIREILAKLPQPNGESHVEG